MSISDTEQPAIEADTRLVARDRIFGRVAHVAALAAVVSVILLVAGDLADIPALVTWGAVTSAVVAIGWQTLRTYWVRRFRAQFPDGAVPTFTEALAARPAESLSDPSEEDQPRAPLMGLSPTYLGLVLALSAICAIAIFAATRVTGAPGLIWGIAAMVCGCGIAWVRLRGYQQRMEAEAIADPLNDSAHELGEGWQRVSQRATNQLVDGMVKTLAALSVGTAVVAQLCFASVTVTVIGLTIIIVLISVIAQLGSNAGSRRGCYLLIALLALIMLAVNGSAGHSAVLLAWATAACILAPMTFGVIGGTSTMISVAGVTVISMIILWDSGLPAFKPAENPPAWLLDWLLIPAAAMCLGMVSVVLTSSLRMVAQVHDAIAIAAWNRLQAATARAGFASAMFEASRMLHDTLINTLGAVRSGLVDPARARNRLRDDLALINTEMTRPDLPDYSRIVVADVLRELQQRAELLGVSLEIRAPADALLTTLDGDHADAIAGASREALTNISKYATHRHALITLQCADTQMLLRIRSESLSAVTMAPTGGIQQSILERSRRAGIRADLASIDGYNVIELAWAVGKPIEIPEQSDSYSFSTSDYLQSVTVAACRSIIFWPIGYCILLSAVWAGVFSWSWWAIGVFAVVGSTAALINYVAANRLPATGLMGIAGLVTTSLAVIWQAFGSPAYQAGSLTSPMGMSYVGAATVAITLISMDDSLRQCVLSIIAYWVGALLLTAIILHSSQPAQVPVITAGLFTVAAIAVAVGRRKLQALGLQAEQTAAGFAEAESRAIIAKEKERARQRGIRDAIGENWQFLEELSNGTAQPENALQRIGEIERLLRTYVHVGSEPGLLTDELLGIISAATSYGIEVDVVAVDTQPDTELPDHLQPGSVCEHLLACATAASHLSITTYRDRDTSGITFVLDQPVEVPAHLETIDDVEWITTEDQTFIELHYPSPRPDTRPMLR